VSFTLEKKRKTGWLHSIPRELQTFDGERTRNITTKTLVFLPNNNTHTQNRQKQPKKKKRKINIKENGVEWLDRGQHFSRRHTQKKTIITKKEKKKSLLLLVYVLVK
jgi:hypothetical protein